jgi:hypothetical protein
MRHGTDACWLGGMFGVGAVLPLLHTAHLQYRQQDGPVGLQIGTITRLDTHDKHLPWRVSNDRRRT